MLNFNSHNTIWGHRGNDTEGEEFSDRSMAEDLE